MPYTNEDARFDDHQLNGPRCPRHGRHGCSCCEYCGRSTGHAPTCRNPSAEVESYDAALAHIVDDPTLTAAQRYAHVAELNRYAPGGGYEFSPCEQCGNESFLHDDGDIRCDNCGHVYGEDL
jgi:hypothetical protein